MAIRSVEPIAAEACLVCVANDFTGSLTTHVMNIPAEAITAWLRGDRPIQEMLPTLSANERELLLTGMTAEDWDLMFPDDDDDDGEEA